MTKHELVQKVATRTGLDERACSFAVEGLMKEIKAELAAGGAVYLRNFGTFKLKHRARKIGRNIKRNTQVVIPAHSIPFFDAAPQFREKVKNVSTTKPEAV